MIREIDRSHGTERAAFDLFRGFGYPYFNLCADVDVTRLRRERSRAGASFTVSLVHLLARAANAIPEFRRRIRGDRLIEHDRVHPSIAVLADDERLGFCTIEYCEAPGLFAERATGAIDRARRRPSLVDEPGRDDYLFMTAIPWISFSSLVHPVPLDPPDSIPRIAWGRYRRTGDRWAMPLSVQAHHAIMDGVHVGRFFSLVQAFLDAPGRSGGDGRESPR